MIFEESCVAASLTFARLTICTLLPDGIIEMIGDGEGDGDGWGVGVADGVGVLVGVGVGVGTGIGPFKCASS